MGHRRNRNFGGHGGFAGPGGHGPRGRGGRGATPPWMAGLFGMEERGRGPRVRRGDVRSAILDVLSNVEGDEPINGYQMIQQITDRSGGVWRPSPGSVYPTIAQLQDEGLVHVDDERRRALQLTEAGRTYVAEHPDELAAVWRPFAEKDAEEGEYTDIRAEIGQVMSAVWQVATQGSEDQRRAAVEVLVGARRSLYGILADGPEGS